MVVTLRVQVGPWQAVLGAVPYLTEETVRRINRRRARGKARRLRFRSKTTIARDLFRSVSGHLKQLNLKVYVLFDSWYASARFMRQIRRHGFHYICSLRKNRTLDGVSLKALNATARRNQEKSQRVTLESSSGRSIYYVVPFRGRLNNLPGPVCVIASRRHPRSRSAEYFLTSDCSLSPCEILKHYQARWPIEVDYLYAKMRLGIGQFRMRRTESVEKWLFLVFLALNYLYFQRALLITSRITSQLSLAQVIRLHQRDFTHRQLREVCKLALRYRSTRKALQQYGRKRRPPFIMSMSSI